MDKIFYENLNKSNFIFYKDFMRELSKINMKGTYILKNLFKFETIFLNI